MPTRRFHPHTLALSLSLSLSLLSLSLLSLLSLSLSLPPSSLSLSRTVSSQHNSPWPLAGPRTILSSALSWKPCRDRRPSGSWKKRANLTNAPVYKKLQRANQNNYLHALEMWDGFLTSLDDEWVKDPNDLRTSKAFVSFIASGIPGRERGSKPSPELGGARAGRTSPPAGSGPDAVAPSSR
ncbi:hypothetical protein LshimejAT787_0303670 [Lyophyllum shimeji]|uniref:Uncharacterized protein n=1 Tax=Lyophyllum shimeji TaxID=47721 RepID=A0A9P3PIJ7_LYOSH|nr:hypothetical protein LshimejAT787_0303670 [Lyophyllum shimeji]